jgi:hypothetical protein
MAKKEKPQSGRGKVSTRRDLWNYTVFPRDGYVLPSELAAHAELSDGTVVDVDVEITGGRARAHRVSLTAKEGTGIGWTELSRLPLRDIVGTAVLDALMKAAPGDDGTIHLAPLVKADSDEVRQIVQGAVGYSPNYKGFERVAS